MPIWPPAQQPTPQPEQTTGEEAQAFLRQRRAKKGNGRVETGWVWVQVVGDGGWGAKIKGCDKMGAEAQPGEGGGGTASGASKREISRPGRRTLASFWRRRNGWRCRLQKLEDMNALRVPPEWSEYIPKKNRHSESVPRSLSCWGVWGGMKMDRESIKSVQHPVFPSGRPPQY